MSSVSGLTDENSNEIWDGWLAAKLYSSPVSNDTSLAAGFYNLRFYLNYFKTFDELTVRKEVEWWLSSTKLDNVGVLNNPYPLSKSSFVFNKNYMGPLLKRLTN